MTGAVPYGVDAGEFERILDQLPEAVAVFRAVRDGDGLIDDFVVDYVNRATARIGLGWDRVARRPLLEVYPTLKQTPHFAGYVSAIETGETFHFTLPDFQDGEVVGSFEGTATRFGDGVVVSFRNVTARIHAERALIETHDQLSAERQRYRQALESSVELLSSALEARDPYTAGHQTHVADLSVAIGEQLGLDADRMQGLRLGATVHDLGKIAVPLEILSKPGRLSPEEMALVQRHATVGWEIASRFSWPWPIADIVHQHHERLDGSGYPSGLAGAQILLEARIVAVADTFEAMSHQRPYRTVEGRDAALEEITGSRGRLFDPDVVDGMLAVLDEGYEFAGG